MNNPQHAGGRGYSKTKNKSLPLCSSVPQSQLLQMDDVLEMIFDCLDIPSLKQCRLTCSAWTPLATRLLMQRTFCKLSSTEKTSLSSVKIDGAELSKLLSQTRLRSSVRTHWKSIFFSPLPSIDGLYSLISFLDLISSSHCPQLTEMKIHFKLDPTFLTTDRRAALEFVNRIGKLIRLKSSVHDPSKFKPISGSTHIRSLQLSFDHFSNILHAAAVSKILLQQNAVPNLKEIKLSLLSSNSTEERSSPHRPLLTTFKKIVEMLQKHSGVLGSLRVLKIKTDVPVGTKDLERPAVQEFLQKQIQSLPDPSFRLELSSEIKELQWGSGTVALRKENDVELPKFLPGVLTQCVASSLETLDLSGVYISEGDKFILPSVKFPHMPCLRKLSMEEVAIKSLSNFPTIFGQAPAIREFRVKNMWDGWKTRTFFAFLKVEEVFQFEKWGNTWGLGQYPSLRLLQLGDSVNVQNTIGLWKLGRIFPNVEVFQFACDDEQRRLKAKAVKYSCEIEFMSLKGIMEGIKGWNSLKHLKVTYWPLYSVNELLDHFLGCSTKISCLRLYDFCRSDEDNPSLRMEELQCHSFLARMQDKLLELKGASQTEFILHNFQCSHQHRMCACGVKGSFSHLRKCFVMEELFKFVKKEGISNFRGAAI